MKNEKMPDVKNDLEKYVFVNVTVQHEVIFENRKPVVILSDVLQPIVKLENCVWLQEIE